MTRLLCLIKFNPLFDPVKLFVATKRSAQHFSNVKTKCDCCYWLLVALTDFLSHVVEKLEEGWCWRLWLVLVVWFRYSRFLRFHLYNLPSQLSRPLFGHFGSLYRNTASFFRFMTTVEDIGRWISSVSSPLASISVLCRVVIVRGGILSIPFWLSVLSASVSLIFVWLT